MAEYTKIILLATIVVYFVGSLQVFNRVYESSNLVVDELFHFEQGLQYCEKNFSHWNPKITTLPGLYIISTFAISPFVTCTKYSLRFLNLLASCLNLYLFAKILCRNQDGSKSFSSKTILQALNLALLPPLYFFSHVYYTDTLSLTFVLILINISMKQRYVLTACSGAFSVLMRQTNISWVLLYFFKQSCDLIYEPYHKNITKYWKSKDKQTAADISKLKKNSKNDDVEQISAKRTASDIENYGFTDFCAALVFNVETKGEILVKSLKKENIIENVALWLVLIGFTIFVAMNGSIVLGDKSAHTATLHIPQLFYFTLFYAIFSMPFVLLKMSDVLTVLARRKLITTFITLLILLIIYLNTIVHPYLLADNRHYTFYIWNRFYGNYWYVRYLMAPVYVFLSVSIYQNIRNSVSIAFLMPFYFGLFITLAQQTMIEVRYYFVPFVMLRLHFTKPPWWVIIVESVLFSIINAVTYNVFFTKEIVWTDFDDVQRLIW